MQTPKGALLPLLWHDPTDDESQHGEGISRPHAEARTKPFRVRVKKPNALPMIWTMRAESKRHAIKYALARWPGATAEVIEP